MQEKEEQKLKDARIHEEKRIDDENERMKVWEKNFDAEQKKKEEELLKKFYNDEKQNERAESDTSKKFN
jgi:hypothetical protein